MMFLLVKQVIDYVTAGIEDICHQRGRHVIRERCCIFMSQCIVTRVVCIKCIVYNLIVLIYCYCVTEVTQQQKIKRSCIHG